MRKYTKESAIKVIVSCAEKYKEELSGRMLLFICENKPDQISCFEFTFNDCNFMHLTGLKVKRRDSGITDEKDELAAVDFYQRCLTHKLSSFDFEFSKDGTTHMKLDVLPFVLNKNLSAKMIGEYNSSKPRLYTERLAGGTSACVGFVTDSISRLYVPNTILKEDNFGRILHNVRFNHDQKCSIGLSSGE